MNFRNLPASLKACIERARMERELQFTQLKNHLPSLRAPHVTSRDRLRCILIEQIQAEVLKVAQGACVSVRGGELKASDIRVVVHTLLKMRCSELCPDPGSGWGDRSYKFLGEVKESLFSLSEWEAHLTERLLRAVIGVPIVTV